MESKLVDTRSIYHEPGATLSYNMRLGNGVEVEPCLKAAIRKKLVDDDRAEVNSGSNFVNDLSGRHGMYQVGIEALSNSALSGHFGVGYNRGADVESPWNAVTGVNWLFQPSIIKLRFGTVFVYGMLKEKILGQKKPASYGGKPHPMGEQRVMRLRGYHLPIYPH